MKNIYELANLEIERQKNSLSLIPSENYSSEKILKVMGTPLSNKYSEGYSGKRYYGGNEFIDQIEDIAIARAKELFKADHANVQPHSGSQANAAVYLGLLKPGDKILGIDLSAGGHLTHGSPVNFSGKTYNFAHYGVDKETEMIDFDKVLEIAEEFKPKLIIVSTTSYSRTLHFDKFKEIADKIGCYLMADISHVAGLVVAEAHPHPFPYCDVVTTTTHKTLRGPRGGLILCKKELAKKIDSAVFPGTQGGPLDHVVAAKAICFEEALRPEFKEYGKQIVLNAKAMEKVFLNRGVKIISGGTDNHMMVLDITKYSDNSKELQDVLDSCGICLNRNTIPFETRSPFNPSGIRLGTPGITTRGFKEENCEELANLIVDLIEDYMNEEVQEKTKKRVSELCKEFPIYENFKW